MTERRTSNLTVLFPPAPQEQVRLIPGSAYLFLRLSALECLISLADCLAYYAFCV